MAPLDLAELFCQTQEAIADYQARMRAVPPTFQPGDRVELYGEAYEIFIYQREVESGYWLRRRKDEVFVQWTRKSSCVRCCNEA